jgi:hypothetical protein
LSSDLLAWVLSSPALQMPAVARALRMPLAFPRIEAEFRHVITRKFPYSVIYHPSESELVVVSFFHHRRKPGSWMQNPRG